MDLETLLVYNRVSLGGFFMNREISEQLIHFIHESYSCYHVVENIKKLLKEKGYEEIFEAKAWQLKEGGKYFVTRNSSSLIAFSIPKKEFQGFQIIASHTDSPTFKIKNNAEISVHNKYVKLNVEKYGSMIMAPWFDRPLSVAGKVIVETESGICSKLVNVDRDLLLIPNLAIHMNRKVNDGYVYNPQIDMLPLYGGEEAKGTFLDVIAKAANVEKEKIIDSDLFLYSREKGTIWGANQEFISSPKLDDLQCAFAALKGFLESENTKSVPVYAAFDNEEVGSTTKQGAASTFLKDTLTRINLSLNRTREDYFRAVASSMMVSTDNAHALHPNYEGKTDPTNRPYINDGIVIKYHAGQKYTTDSVSGALFKKMCKKANVPYQVFFNRSDMIGGSTLGNISNTQVSLNTVDIGLPQLSMHSPYETAGVKDTYYLVKAAREVFSSSMMIKGDGCLELF